MKQRRIGLLGGTFNPIHNGHLHIAHAVSHHLRLDLVLFIPSNIPPHKETRTLPPANDRMEMVRLALSESPQFKPCDVEIKRSGPSYTIETVRILKKRYSHNRLFFIIGMDAFSQIETWKEPDQLLGLCDFAIIPRPAYPFSLLPSFGPLESADPSALTQLDREEIGALTVPVRPKTELHLINISHSPISSSVIRKRVSEGSEIRNLLPRSVESYIIKHNIYKGDDDF